MTSQEQDIFNMVKKDFEELEKEIAELKRENKILKEHKFVYDKDVWSPVELHRILDNYDLNWNGVCKEVEKLKKEKDEKEELK